MKLFKRGKKNRAQTALEYALVVGVISVGVIIAAKKIFGPGQNGQQSGAEKIMQSAIDQATGTMQR